MWIAIQNAVGARQGVGGGPGPTPPYTPPLDAYPADIAYSVRKLSSSYSGPCMEVERGVDAATLDIGFDTNGLLDTQAIIDFATAGGGSGEIRIRTWYDQTGNSRHAQTSVAGDMSYIYSGSAIYQANGKPVVDPRGTNDGLYPILGTYSTAANNTIFTVISPGQTGGSYVMTRPIGSGGSGILGAGIEEPIAGWNSNIDYGFGTTQYYRDGAFYGNSTLQRNDIMQSVLASRRIFDIGFTQSGLNSLNFGRNGSSSIYATQEYIVYFSDQLGTVPRTALEGNINSYYQVANLPNYTSGFLADYPDAAAAYSVRKLSNTAIKCMRVRRTVAPFDEQDIGFTAGGDLDEAAIVAFGGADTLVVSRWYDQSGFSRHAVQNIPGNQPQIYNGTAVITENGKPAINFQNDVLATSGNITLSDGAYFSVAVGTTNGGANNVMLASDDTPRVGQFVRASAVNTLQSIGFTSGGAAVTATGPSVGVNNQFLGIGECTGTILKAYVDGTSGTSSSLTNRTDAAPLYVGARKANVQDAHNGYIQEIIHYASDQSSNRPAIETNINDYYKIIINDAAATSGFLFDYPNAAAAYSVRQLNNNAEYCMRVERSGNPNDTLNVGFDANGDLDTAAITSFGGSDVLRVSHWYDQSGNQAHMVQDNPTTQPMIYDGASIIRDNNKPCIEFLGASNLELRTVSAAPSVSQPTTYFVTANKPNHSSYLWDGVSSRQAQGDQSWIFAGTLAYNFYPNSALGSQVLFTALFNGASSVGRINATQTATGNPGSNALSGIKLISKEGNKYQELVVYGADQTSQFTPIESNINTYYSIY